MYKYALRHEYICKNYAELIILPQKPKSTRDGFTTEEIERLWADYNSGNEFTGYILIMIYTGMRPGELQSLQKNNIFLEKNYMIGGIKPAAGIDREIAIPKKTKHIVSLFHSVSEAELVPLVKEVFYKNFFETLERARILRLTPHCCRHTFPTLAASAGIQPGIIMEMMGHEDYDTTIHYTHTPVQDKINAATVNLLHNSIFVLLAIKGHCRPAIYTADNLGKEVDPLCAVDFDLLFSRFE